jgi:hypothetical protein
MLLFKAFLLFEFKRKKPQAKELMQGAFVEN